MNNWITRYLGFILCVYVIVMVFAVVVAPRLEHLHDGGLLFQTIALIIGQTYFIIRACKINLGFAFVISLIGGILLKSIAFSFVAKYIPLDWSYNTKHFIIATIYIALFILLLEIINNYRSKLSGTKRNNP